MSSSEHVCSLCGAPITWYLNVQVCSRDRFHIAKNEDSPFSDLTPLPEGTNHDIGRYPPRHSPE